MADWAHDQSCSEVCVSRALEGRSWQEAELDAPRVVHAGNTSIPNIGLEYDLRLTLWGQRRLPAVVAYQSANEEMPRNVYGSYQYTVPESAR